MRILGSSPYLGTAQKVPRGSGAVIFLRGVVGMWDDREPSNTPLAQGAVIKAQAPGR